MPHYYDGPFPENEMWFIEGPPNFAAEVRSESDYGPAAEVKMAEKRADYFLAGTLVVWDVDTIEDLIHAYHASDPSTAITYRKGDIADAGPAVPGWRVPVDEIFELTADSPQVKIPA